MAKNIRNKNSSTDFLTPRGHEIVREALRQSESCLYASAALFEWLKWVRWYHRAFVVCPLVLGVIASWAALDGFAPSWAIAAIALLASLFPALVDGLDIQVSINEISRLASEFKSLQDRFRVLAKISAPFVEETESDKALSQLMDQLDVARKSSITPPDWAFRRAQSNIAKGDYAFSVDA